MVALRLPVPQKTILINRGALSVCCFLYHWHCHGSSSISDSETFFSPCFPLICNMNEHGHAYFVLATDEGATEPSIHLCTKIFVCLLFTTETYLA